MLLFSTTKSINLEECILCQRKSNFPSGEIGRGNYHDSKPLYLGISPQAWLVLAGSASLFPRLNCTHKEADYRMMFHVQDIVSPRSGPVTLSSGDTVMSL